MTSEAFSPLSVKKQTNKQTKKRLVFDSISSGQVATSHTQSKVHNNEGEVNV